MVANSLAPFVGVSQPPAHFPLSSEGLWYHLATPVRGMAGGLDRRAALEPMHGHVHSLVRLLLQGQESHVGGERSGGSEVGFEGRGEVDGPVRLPAQAEISRDAANHVVRAGLQSAVALVAHLVLNSVPGSRAVRISRSVDPELQSWSLVYRTRTSADVQQIVEAEPRLHDELGRSVAADLLIRFSFGYEFAEDGPA